MELNLLALETSSSRCGVALLRAADGRLDVTVREHEGSQEHAERLLPMAGELLAEAGLAPGALHAVAFGQGPGGFTGLRVACGVAQGMALGLDIRCCRWFRIWRWPRRPEPRRARPCWWRWTPA